MNPIFRTILPLFLFAALFGAGCSDDAPLAVDPTQPTPAPGTLSEVLIGCQSGIGAEVRTSLGERDETAVEVRWTEDDTFRLAAREQGADNWLFKDALFALSIYSSKWNTANFVGQVDVSLFSLEKKYDYIAFSPAPQPAAIIVGPKNEAEATFTIPAEQTGDNFASIRHLDIMSASLTDAQPLQAGLTEPAINLAFTHHTHILEFTIPQNNLGEDIRFVKLTFPQPVTGQLTVNALDRTSKLTGGSKELKINFSTPKKAGDTFYAAIAPIALKQNEQIQILVGGSTGYSQLTYTCQAPEGRPMEGGHLTPINLHVLSRTDYQTLTFQLPDDLGTGTLGEKVTKVKVTASSAGAFQGVMLKEDEAGNTNGVISDDAKELTYSVTGNSYMLYCTPEWDSSLSNELTFTYESEHTYGLSDRKTKASGQTEISLNVPYLYKENFANVTDHEESDNNNAQWFSAGNLPDWSGSRWKTHANNCLEITNYIGTTVKNGDARYGRADSPQMKYLTKAATLKITYQIGSTRSRNTDHGWFSPKSDGEAKVTFGTYDENEPTATAGGNGYEVDPNYPANNRTTFNPSDFCSPTNKPDRKEHTLSNCTDKTRLSWVSHHGGSTTAETFYVYLDDIEVKIVP